LFIAHTTNSVPHGPWGGIAAPEGEGAQDSERPRKENYRPNHGNGTARQKKGLKENTDEVSAE